MRKIIVEVEVSLDGVLDGESQDFWMQIFTFHSPDVTEYLDDLLFVPDALILGRETYESFAKVWPTRKGKASDQINGMPKYVASRTLKEPLDWNASLIKGDVVEEIKKLKQEEGNSLLQYGVGELTKTMLDAGLVDEFLIMTFPFSYGKGRRLFENMGVNTMKLLDTKTFSSGASVQRYEPQKSA